MPTTSEEHIYTSKPFPFIVQGKTFYVHSAYISACSAPLDRMISGHLKEAIQGFAELNEVTAATFARFSDWLYKNDYKAAAHTINGTEAQSSAPATPVETADDDWGSWGVPSKKKKKDKKSYMLRTALKEMFISSDTEGGDDDAVKATASIGPIRANKSPEEDYTAVFLSHAHLYVFAEQYDIQNLKRLALRKLKHTLSIFTFYESRVEDIMCLLRYVFAETAATRPGEQNIRTMLMLYASTVMDILHQQEEFRDMLAEDPEIMKDFLTVLSTKINRPG